MPDIEAIFSEDGPLARRIEHFRPRPQQREMAQAIMAAIAGRGVLIAEAGTGTGKTLAYLVPVLLSGGKTVISTGTKTLQDQLFARDLPAAKGALGIPARIALLKGRANYVCHYHLARAGESGLFGSREDAAYLPVIKRFARASATGDKADLAEVPENAGVWPFVTSTRDNCLGQDCPHHADCFVLKARKQAQEADIVVVNHHLFFADVALRQEGVAELLPACNTVVFDEAHQLPETAAFFFGESLSTQHLLLLARQTLAEGRAAAADFEPLTAAAHGLEQAARDLRLAFGGDNARLPAQAAFDRPGFEAALTELATALDRLETLLAAQAERSAGLKGAHARAQDLAAQLNRWQLLIGTEEVRWLEVFSQSVHLNATPLSVAGVFGKQIEETARAWVFTSATLAVNGDFGHYQRLMGLTGAETRAWASPFDYPAQALLYVPRGLPEPQSPAYLDAVIAAVVPALRASRGRAFLLFTTLRALSRAERLLREAGLEYPLLVQGQASRAALLARFRRLGNAVLLGSQSFWEGVDVRGEALSLVVIDKLPFAPPDDPVLAARIAEYRREERDAFAEFQLPHAAITLKQGAGRLIRDERDRGVLMICDPRLVTKSYGSLLWKSLPPMRRTRELTEVERFFGQERLAVAPGGTPAPPAPATAAQDSAEPVPSSAAPNPAAPPTGHERAGV